MAIKWLITDLDGTLLNSKKEVSPRNAAALKKAMDKGIGVTFATGRMHASAERFAKNLGIVMPLVSCNGAYIKSCSGEVFAESHMDPAVTKEMLEFCREKEWHIQWYIDDMVYVNHYKPDMWLGYESLDNIRVREAKDDFDTYSKRVVQMVILNRDGQMAQIDTHVRDRFADRLHMPVSSDYGVDIVPVGMNKAVGIDQLAKKYGIDATEIMVIGDSPNDLDMMKYAGLSVAMGSGYEIAKQTADVMTSGADEDGFADAVERYLLK